MGQISALLCKTKLNIEKEVLNETEVLKQVEFVNIFYQL